MRTFVVILFHIFYPFFSLCKRLKMTGLSEEERIEYAGLEMNRWFRILFKATGSKINLVGEENLPDVPAVYVSNHQGNADVGVMVMLAKEPRAFLAKKELGSFPVLGKWLVDAGCIFVDRDDPNDGLKAILKAIKHVKNGNSINIFPEGTRSRCDKMGEFKSGASLVATKGKALIVPITIDGSYKVFENNKGFKVKPTVINVTVHKPIDPAKMAKEEIKELDQKIKEIIQSKLPVLN